MTIHGRPSPASEVFALNHFRLRLVLLLPRTPMAWPHFSAPSDFSLFLSLSAGFISSNHPRITAFIARQSAYVTWDSKTRREPSGMLIYAPAARVRCVCYA
jgi:hypothetical protein